MYCPNCGVEDRSDNKFCTRCGTNLQIVSAALVGKPPEGEEESFVRKLAIQQELVDQREVLKRRHGMLTGGIICVCVGFGIMAFLALMVGMPTAMAGMIPLMVGVGLILSALLLHKPKRYPEPRIPEASAAVPAIGSPSDRPMPSYPDSVTAETTRHLREVKPPPRNTPG